MLSSAGTPQGCVLSLLCFIYIYIYVTIVIVLHANDNDHGPLTCAAARWAFVVTT